MNTLAKSMSVRSHAIALALLCVPLVACSVAPPVFMAQGTRLLVVATDAEGGRDERLSFFTSVADGDGVDDIELLYIVHDGEELCWTLEPATWQRSDEGASVWVGSNTLDAPGPTIPRGQYRAILIDKAGERGESTFLINAPETSVYDIPSVRLSGTSITVGSPYPSNTAFFLDSGGNVTKTIPVAKGEIPLDSLWPNGQWRSGADYIAVYGLDPKSETGFFSWKIRLPD